MSDLRVTSCRTSRRKGCNLRRYSWWRGRTLVRRMTIANGIYVELDLQGFGLYRVLGGEKVQRWDPERGWKDTDE